MINRGFREFAIDLKNCTVMDSTLQRGPSPELRPAACEKSGRATSVSLYLNER